MRENVDCRPSGIATLPCCISGCVLGDEPDLEAPPARSPAGRSSLDGAGRAGVYDRGLTDAHFDDLQVSFSSAF